MQGPHTSIKMPQLHQHRGSVQGKRPETACGSSVYSDGKSSMQKINEIKQYKRMPEKNNETISSGFINLYTSYFMCGLIANQRCISPFLCCRTDIIIIPSDKPFLYTRGYFWTRLMCQEYNVRFPCHFVNRKHKKERKKYFKQKTCREHSALLQHSIFSWSRY